MKLLPNCREVARLVSEGLDRDLGLVDRTRVRMHLAMCDGCTHFRKHMTLIRDVVRRWPDGPN